MKLSQLLYSTIFISSFAYSADIVTTPLDRSELSMTVYSNGLAMVQDQRQVDIPSGRHMLSYEGVSNALHPSSALFSGDNLSVLQQVFDYALMSDENMLRLSEGKKVKLLRYHPETGEEIIEEATIITTKPQLVLQTERGIETTPAGRIVFTEIPDGLSKAPALKLFLEAESAGNKKVDLTYLTNGFSWKADYIGRLNSERTKIEIRALATITNDTEVGYENAHMSLIAGDVQRSSSPRIQLQYKKMPMEIMEDVEMAANENIGNFQLFKLPEVVNLESQQTRQFPLLPIKEIEVKQIFKAYHSFHGQQESFSAYNIERPQTYMEFINHMGSPMPQGIFRVYETDSMGKDHFTGENYINDIAEGEPARLSLGESYNLRVYRKQTNWQPVGENGGTATYEVKVTNASDTDAIVHITENIQGSPSVKSKAVYVQEDSQNYTWEVNVPAKGEAIVTYTLTAKQR